MPITNVAGTSSGPRRPPRLARSSVGRKPLPLATVAPRTTISTMPSGGKPVKVRGISMNSRRTLASDSRLATCSDSPVTGFTADQPSAAPATEMAVSTAIMPTKIRIGSGSALPSRSTASRKPLRGATGRETSAMGQPPLQLQPVPRAEVHPRRRAPLGPRLVGPAQLRQRLAPLQVQPAPTRRERLGLGELSRRAGRVAPGKQRLAPERAGVGETRREADGLAQ